MSWKNFSGSVLTRELVHALEGRENLVRRDLQLCQGWQHPFLIPRRTSVVFVYRQGLRMPLSTGPILVRGHGCGRDDTVEISCGKHEIFRLVKQSFQRRVFRSELVLWITLRGLLLEVLLVVGRRIYMTHRRGW